MTAFLFIPAATEAGPTRRVDLADFASLFAEIEEPTAVRERGPRVVRLLAMILVIALAIGDAILVARPDALAHAATGLATGVISITSL